MLNLDHILFPVDFSEPCLRAAPFVRYFARKTGARVTLLHVIETSPAYYADWAEYPSLDLRPLMRERKRELRQFLRGEFQDLPTVQRILRHGDPARVIADYASKRRVGLIMMPTRGVGRFRQFLLGSVAAKVLHDAACPVWTSAHAQETACWIIPEGCSKILCAVDLTESSVEAVKYAAELAQTLGAELRLVHVVPASESPAVKYFETEFVKALSDVAQEQMAKLQKEAGTSAEALIRSGDITRVVRQAAFDSQPDLIVIGRGVLQEKLGRLRTQAYSIIRESPRPVISV